MNNSQTMTKTLTKAPRAGNKLGFCSANAALLEARKNKSLIQWPAERDLQQVSKRLAQIQQAGRRLEASGDYFRSGDLAYQIQEIIRATAELLKKSQRAEA